MANVTNLVEHLEQLAAGRRCDLAFDGDGTLWAGDVSDDVFLAACTEEWFLEPLRPPLCSILREHGFATEGSLGTLTRRLFDAEKNGAFEERLLFEVMTWCYVGRSFAELAAFARSILTRAGIETRVRQGLLPLLNWAQASGHHCWLVTASPLPIVKVVANPLGFDDGHIVASCPVVSASGTIEPAMASRVPYREQKILQLNFRSSDRPLLAAFGDSPFDIDLLRAAEVAVAVNPKPQLSQLLPTLAHAWSLQL